MIQHCCHHIALTTGSLLPAANIARIASRIPCTGALVSRMSFRSKVAWHVLHWNTNINMHELVVHLDAAS